MKLRLPNHNPHRSAAFMPLHRADLPPPTSAKPGQHQLSAVKRHKCSAPVTAILACLIGLAGLSAAAQTGTQREYELKAGVLYHIIEYVEWPTVTSASNQPPPIQIGLLGQIPFANALEVLDGKTLRGRKLVVKQLTDRQQATQCQVVFISASEKSRMNDIIAEVKNRPVLTVGEVEGFAEQGGIVNLLAGQNRIIMEINRATAGESRLGISSQLLKLAKVYPR
jgi:hypothetical protein